MSLGGPTLKKTIKGPVFEKCFCVIMIYLYFFVGLCSSGPIARARFKIGGLSLKKINKRIFAWKEVQAGKKDSKNCQITSFDVHHWAGGEKNTVVFSLRFVDLFFLLQFCYKLIQLFRVTCFIAGQYNTGLQVLYCYAMALSLLMMSLRYSISVLCELIGLCNK